MTPAAGHPFLREALDTWSSGGWLMVPLLALTVFLYFIALDLFIRLNTHFLVRSGVHHMTDGQIAVHSRNGWGVLRRLLLEDAADAREVRRHFFEVRQEYLPVIDRRVRFLGALIPVGPLMGLLGTVTGMLSTFDGMVAGQGTRFGRIVEGISEALITTQTGLVISIPALVILSLIVQRRNRLESGLARLERYNTCLVLKVGCPIPANRPEVSR